MKKILAPFVIAGSLFLAGCGGNQEQQVATCINRHNDLEDVVALDLCQGAYTNGNYDHASYGDMMLVYMMMSGSYSYPLLGSPFVPYGRYNYVSATNTTIINNYGGVSSISAKPTKPAKTSPLKAKSSGTKAPVKKQPKPSKSAEPPKTSTVPKSSGAKLPEPAKPQTTAKPKTQTTTPPKTKTTTPKPKTPTTKKR